MRYFCLPLVSYDNTQSSSFVSRELIGKNEENTRVFDKSGVELAKAYHQRLHNEQNLSNSPLCASSHMLLVGFRTSIPEFESESIT